MNIFVSIVALATAGMIITVQHFKKIEEPTYHCMIPDTESSKKCRVLMREDIYMEGLKENNTTKSN